MKTMDNALMDLVDKGLIDGKEAYLQANHRAKFERFQTEE